jgi:hypothetical protein
MKLLTKMCLPALMLGAAALVAPAMAQNDASASGNNGVAAAAPAQPAQDANSAPVPVQPAQDANGRAIPDRTAMNGQPSSNGTANASSSSAGNSQMAMNTTGNASDLSSIPDNRHKYSRAKRAADNQSEDETTKQLNQQESNLNGGSHGNAQ